MAEEKLMVAAIDFGTTFSGYAFSFRHEFELDPLRISTNTAWTTGGRGMMSWKTPTSVLLDSKQTFHSFGFAAEDKYCELAENEEHEDWYFYRRFKMLLFDHAELKRDTMIPDALGKNMPAKTIFSLAIRYIKEHLLGLVSQRGLDVRPDDILWVLTVPAIWDEPAKQFMRETAVEAGILSKNLKLALEPEAASIYCKSIPLERQKGEEGQAARLGPFSPGTRYMVLDIGGGTVDVTVHEVRDDGKLKELHKASGGAWGGTRVDASYFDLFKNIFGEDLMEEFKHQYKYEDLEMQRDFETKKRTVKGEDQRVIIHVSACFNEFVKEKTDTSAQELVNKAGMEAKITFKRDRIQFQGQVIRDLFEPSIQSIIAHVKEVIQTNKVQRIDKILMVGGFSECCLVRHAIKEAFPELHVVAPDEPGLAVLKGAVIFGHSPEEISSRVSRYTYGVAVQGHYMKGYHPEDQQVQIGDEIFCNNLFSKLIEIDSDTGVAETVKKNYPIHDRNMPLVVAIYVSKKPYPIMVTEEGCKKLVEITINTPIGGWRKDASVDVELGFGGTEFTVIATETLSQIQQEAKCDFLI